MWETQPSSAPRLLVDQTGREGCCWTSQHRTPPRGRSSRSISASGMLVPLLGQWGLPVTAHAHLLPQDRQPSGNCLCGAHSIWNPLGKQTRIACAAELAFLFHCVPTEAAVNQMWFSADVTSKAVNNTYQQPAAREAAGNSQGHWQVTRQIKGD